MQPSWNLWSFKCHLVRGDPAALYYCSVKKYPCPFKKILPLYNDQPVACRCAERKRFRSDSRNCWFHCNNGKGVSFTRCAAFLADVKSVVPWRHLRHLKAYLAIRNNFERDFFNP